MGLVTKISWTHTFIRRRGLGFFWGGGGTRESDMAHCILCNNNDIYMRASSAYRVVCVHHASSITHKIHGLTISRRNRCRRTAAAGCRVYILVKLCFMTLTDYILLLIYYYMTKYCPRSRDRTRVQMRYYNIIRA